MKNFTAMVTPNSVSVMIDGKTHAITDAHINYLAIREALKKSPKEAEAAVRKLVDVPASVAAYSRGLVKVVGGAVTFAGNVIHNVVADRILALMAENYKIDHLVAFLDKLLQNPSKTAVDELYLFLEKANLPITEDGDFLAYKIVRGDYKDHYTGKFDNSVGAKPTMARSDVDTDRNNTCSVGLHFCSQGYLPHYGSQSDSRIMIVKINPADVVSIPSDYDNAKGRCWTYLVVGEAEALYQAEDRLAVARTVFTSPVYGADGVTPVAPDRDDDSSSSEDSSSDDVVDSIFDDSEASSSSEDYDDSSSEGDDVAYDDVTGESYDWSDLSTPQQAAARLGVTTDALRKRMDRGVTARRVTVDGTVWVFIP